MSVGWRGTLVLAVLVIAAGVYVWFENAGGRPDLSAGAPPVGVPTREPTHAFDPVLTVAPADISRVTLQRDGEQRVSQRQNARWTGVSPADAVDEFLANLTQLGVLATIPAGDTELGDYGLAPPHAVVELSRADGRATTLQIGDRNPATTGVYVRRDGGKVMLAGALLDWEVDKLFKALSGPPPR